VLPLHTLALQRAQRFGGFGIAWRQGQHFKVQTCSAFMIAALARLARTLLHFGGRSLRRLLRVSVAALQFGIGGYQRQQHIQVPQCLCPLAALLCRQGGGLVLFLKGR